jgi:hypothetical protein
MFLVSASGVVPVMRKGDPIVGLPGVTLNVIHTSNNALNENEWIAVQVTLAGAGVTTANDGAILVGPAAGPLFVAVREGDAAPGTGGVFDGVISYAGPQLNNSNQFIFTCPAIGGFNPNQSSLFAWDPVAGIVAVSVNGEQHEVQPGVFKTSTSMGGIQFSNGDGRSLSFSDAGHVSLRQSYTDGTSSIIVCRIPSFSGAPAAISTATGGTQNFALAAGVAHAGMIYYVVGSASGATPGFPYGPLAIPLNYDFYTDFTINFANVFPLTNTLGFLDATGHGAASFTLPTGFGILAGLSLHHAYVVLDLAVNPVYVSEPVQVNFLP